MKSMKSKNYFELNIAEEKERASKILQAIGFSLDEHQPHISGERYLMTRNKLVLIGRRLSDGKKVIIKISKHPDGKKEIKTEKDARDLLSTLPFTDDSILFPEEVYFETYKDYLVWISSYISQDKVFVAHPIEDQFFTALRAFETKESFHATTFEHIKSIENVFPVFRAKEYFDKFKRLSDSFQANYHDEKIEKTLDDAREFLYANKTIIDRYSGYLTHTDFVPHNFRIKERNLYMLDCSAVHFGNKYEGWARFLNYMVIHNTKLERLLFEYLRKNRSEEENKNLRLMRVYKIVQLLEYYARSSKKADGDLFTLILKRINFWHQILQLILKDEPIKDELIENYILERNNLRSEEEKNRQREFAIA